MRLLNHILILLFFALLSVGQTLPHKEKILIVSSDTLKVDSLTLQPGTVTVFNDSIELDSTHFQLDHARSLLLLKKGTLSLGDTLKVRYRTLNVQLGKTWYHKRFNPYPDESGMINPFSYVPEKRITDPLKLEGLTKNGSISRGISFGNTQDVVVNSNLNLQLSGNLTEDVQILASITDENIPLQPEGNTHQLQEFDKVFIQLYNNNTRLTAGDFQLVRPPGHFLNYYKRAQGLSFGGNYGLGKNYTDTTGISTKVRLSAAVSKGKFSRNVFRGVEGNQGPYRLRGAEGEAFIIILAGTEKVFIDGVPMVRGQDYDYVIDYNLAEVVFTPRQLITKDKRIVVEFQYSEKNFARSLVEFGNSYELGRLSLNLNYYKEQDNKNKPLLQALTNEQKQILFNVGDDLNSAIAPAVDSVAYSQDKILYSKKDTLINDVIYSFYEYSNDPTNAKYFLSFSEVGQGNGNYVLDRTLATGKIFRWVAPVNGARQGKYEPVILLITPKLKQMVALGGKYAISKNHMISAEGALSTFDKNTFSPVDSQDDDGQAWRFYHEFRVPLIPSKKIDIKTITNYEFVQKTFSEIERFRSVEFERDWNRGTAAILNNQHVGSAAVQLLNSSNDHIGYASQMFMEEGGLYKGFRQRVNVNINDELASANIEASMLNSSDSVKTTSFVRSKGFVEKPLGKLKLGWREDFEHNMQRQVFADAISPSSYGFFEWQAYLNTPDTASRSYFAGYTRRIDNMFNVDRLSPATLGESYQASTQLVSKKFNVTRINSTFRTLKILDSTSSTLKNDQTLISRIENSSRWFKNMVSAETFYEIGTGLEMRKEFTYIEVAAGQGVYSWEDYNANGLKELNEFEITPFRDRAKYIKVFTPTNQFVKVYSNQFNEVLNINPAVYLENKTGLLKLIGRFSTQTAYRVERKSTERDIIKSFNPFLNVQSDSALMSTNESFRNTVFFNRNVIVFGLEYITTRNRAKNLLTNGFETRQLLQDGVRVRYNISRLYTLRVEANRGNKINSSEFLPTRNYNIAIQDIEPSFIFQPNTNFRSSVLYRYASKDNRGEEIANSVQQKLGTEIRYNLTSKGSLSATFNFIYLTFEGNRSSPVGFEILEALQPGKNYTWNLTFQRNIGNNLQLNLNYDGRKSEGSKPVHIGGVQARAFF